MNRLKTWLRRWLGVTALENEIAFLKTELAKVALLPDQVEAIKRSRPERVAGRLYPKTFTQFRALAETGETQDVRQS